MCLASEDFREFVVDDPEDDPSLPLGDALAELTIDVDVDSTEAVRDSRERT